MLKKILVGMMVFVATVLLSACSVGESNNNQMSVEQKKQEEQEGMEEHKTGYELDDKQIREEQRRVHEKSKAKLIEEELERVAEESENEETGEKPEKVIKEERDIWTEEEYEEFVNYVVDDCIKNLSSENKIYIVQYPGIEYTHFGIGLYIRNRYIHGKVRSFYPFFSDADDLSSDIVDRLVEKLNEQLSEPDNDHMESWVLLKRAGECEEKGDLDNAYKSRLRVAVEDEDGKAFYDLAQMYEKGIGVPQDTDKAAYYYEQAYVHDFVLPGEVAVLIGSAYERGDKYRDKDAGAAMEWYREAADEDVAYANACMGKLYFKGEGVEQDHEKAYELFMKSGPEETMPLYYLGLMYEEGLYVDSDVSKAKEYYGKAVRDIPEGMFFGDYHYELAKRRLEDLNLDNQ